MAGDGKTYDGNRYAGHDMIYEEGIDMLGMIKHEGVIDMLGMI